MAVHLWLRAETKPNERRTHLTPDRCKELVQAGFKITVEHSNVRIFKDDEFARIEGVNMAPAGSWVEAPKDTFILGLKELPHSSSPIHQTHIYFAHAYRYQSGWAQVLNRFTQGGGSVLDVEYMTDDRNERVITAFPPLAGVAGMGVGLFVWCHKQISPQSPIPALKPYDCENLLVDELKSQLQLVAKAKGVKEFYPRIIVIGALGRCGKGALDMAFKAGIPSTHIAQWDLNETKDGGPFQKILDYDIFVNCIFLMKKIPPFLTTEVLDTDVRQLSVVVDVSCDVTSPNNPLPFYDSITSFEQPCHSIELSNCTKPLDVVAIDNLPTLLPVESSVKFAENITPYVLKLPEADTHPVWVRARQRFKEKAAEALKQ